MLLQQAAEVEDRRLVRNALQAQAGKLAQNGRLIKRFLVPTLQFGERMGVGIIGLMQRKGRLKTTKTRPHTTENTSLSIHRALSPNCKRSSAPHWGNESPQTGNRRTTLPLL
ncbi:hypothetical protein D9M68_930750 [compost metagenome]